MIQATVVQANMKVMAVSFRILNFPVAGLDVTEKASCERASVLTQHEAFRVLAG
jgi:hypothetical protein